MSDVVRRRSSTRLLRRVLEQPDLVSAIQRLSPESLLSLVRRVGLEDAGELLAMVTQEQLVELFDSDLWVPSEHEETLSADRFATWLEVLSESGAAFVADRLAALPDSLLHQALAQQLWVFDLDELATALNGVPSDDPLQKALEAPFGYELDQYLLLSRQPEAWNELLDAVLALDERHTDTLRGVLDRLCGATKAKAETDGLFAVLSEAEQLAEDAVAERADRRSARGFVSYADARAFLTRRDDRAELVATGQRDPIASTFVGSTAHRAAPRHPRWTGC